MKKRRRMNYPLHTCIKILSFSYLVSTTSIILLLLTKHQDVTEALALSSQSSSNTLTCRTRNDRKWIQNFDNLVDYRKIHGTFRVDKNAFPSLGRWAMRQRGFHRRGELREDRVKLLEGISFFEGYDADAYANRRSPDHCDEGDEWQRNFHELSDFVDKHGVLSLFDADLIPSDLDEWMKKQRIMYKKDRGNKRRRAKYDLLKGIGFQFDSRNVLWMVQYVKAKKIMNDDAVQADPSSYATARDINWIKRHQRLYNKYLDGDSTCLSDERYALLKELGIFMYSGSMTADTGAGVTRNSRMTWNDYYDELVKYKKRMGTLYVERQIDPSLTRWVYIQRSRFRKSIMSDFQVAQLEEIGFDFFGGNVSWNERYDQICEFVAIHGHFNISRAENLSLSQFVYYQRRDFRNGRLSQDKINLLSKIGFDFRCDFHTDFWSKYEKLCEYKNDHGHCNVPQRYSENLSLGLFVYNCRQQFKYLLAGERSSLDEERIEALEQIGFCWNAQEFNWFTNFGKLKAFKELHGNCDVPRKYEPDLGLAWWVQYNRIAYKEYQAGRPSFINSIRIKLLEDIGFNWVAPRTTSGPTVQDWANLFNVMRDKLAEPEGTRNFVERLDILNRSRPVAQVDVDSLWNEEGDDDS